LRLHKTLKAMESKGLYSRYCWQSTLAILRKSMGNKGLRVLYSTQTKLELEHLH
jgi:hypothetical protein